MDMNMDLLQYERAKQKLPSLVPPKAKFEYNNQIKALNGFIERLSSSNSGNMETIISDFSVGVSGKSADKIKENLEEVKKIHFYTAMSFGF
ncbi:MAG: hypothetical protein LBI13_10210 [Streptococcaceae bacterium]|jgi:hypothetical protein|nr:hypothetical protein [Streptococcaceae bacterium]